VIEKSQVGIDAESAEISRGHFGDPQDRAKAKTKEKKEVNMPRELVWKDEVAFHGLACSECGWIYPNPAAIGSDIAPTTDVEAKIAYEEQASAIFREHRCGEYPRYIR
jgi:hypothetical protein